MAQTDAEKLFYQAVLKFDQGDITASVDLLNDLVARFPEFGKAYNYLGEIYFLFFKDAVAAETHFKKAIIASPEFSDSYINYVKLLLSRERFAEANANLNKVAEIPGAKKQNVYEQYGVMNELQSKYDDAVSFYIKAIGFSFSDEEIIACEKAIARCKIKKKYL